MYSVYPQSIKQIQGGGARYLNSCINKKTNFKQTFLLQKLFFCIFLDVHTKTSNFPQYSMRLPQRRDRIVRVYNRVYTDISFFFRWLFIYFYLIWKQKKCRGIRTLWWAKPINRPKRCHIIKPN